MGLFEAHEEKKQDIRVTERARLFGRLKAKDSAPKEIPDSAENAIFVNVDELNARDNPVHMARNLPNLDAPVRRNIEDMEFDSDETNRSFEQ